MIWLKSVVCTVVIPIMPHQGKKILNRNIREVSNNNFQFIVFRKIKTKERDGYTNIMR